MQIWELDDLLQQSENNSKSETVAEDSDENEMDLDVKPPKSNKGISGTQRACFLDNSFNTTVRQKK